MKVVIMAGGEGTRIQTIEKNIPKPLITIDGVPIIKRVILKLKEQGFDDFIITVSYQAGSIMEYLKDGRSLSVSIEYYIEKEALGTGGALFDIVKDIKEDFLLLNADVLFDVDINRFYKYHIEKGGLVTVLTHPNSHPSDSGIIISDKNGMVLQWVAKEDKKPQWYKNRVNAGIHMINPKLFSLPEIYGLKSQHGNELVKIDLDRQILKPLCCKGLVYCYDSTEYVKDMGTPDRLVEVNDDFMTGIVTRKNLQNKQKAVFLDRDGTINKYMGFLREIDKFELLSGVPEALKIINKLGYLAIVVTNQPIIARGELTCGDLEVIHNKMETLLGKEGAYIDAIYYCPHHPEKGFKGEVLRLKKECDCRKPKPGMLFQAAEYYNIDLKKSWMVGDGKNDIIAGKIAGCHTVLIGEHNYGQDKTVGSLLEFVEDNLKVGDFL